MQYLSPGERSGHDIDLEVAIEAGATLGDIRCRTHTVEIEREGASRAVVRLTANDRIPNKDFVLRYEVEGAGVTPSAIASATEDGGHIALTITPPPSLAGLPRQPLEFVFVLDCSGSMHGIPLTQAKAAAARAMRRLQPQDSFQIIRFSDNSSALGSRPLEATPDNIRRGLEYLESLNSGGGTMMIEGIKAALGFPHDPERLRFVVFLTDGYIGNETEILREMSQRLGPARVFSFGVGSSTNRYLMERMAQLGRGVSAYITPNDSAVEPMDAFFDRVAFAAMTDVSIDWGGLRVADVQPASIPDLFVGSPVVVTARLLAPAEGGEQIRIEGRAAGKPQSLEAPVIAEGGEGRPAIGHIWARMMLASLMDRAALIDGAEAADLAGDVKRLALAHGLLSAYTAFIAVDSSRRTEGEYGTTVAVPVPVPEGVRYETTVAPAEEGRGG